MAVCNAFAKKVAKFRVCEVGTRTEMPREDASILGHAEAHPHPFQSNFHSFRWFSMHLQESCTVITRSVLLCSMAIALSLLVFVFHLDLPLAHHSCLSFSLSTPRFCPAFRKGRHPGSNPNVPRFRTRVPFGGKEELLPFDDGARHGRFFFAHHEAHVALGDGGRVLLPASDGTSVGVGLPEGAEASSHVHPTRRVRGGGRHERPFGCRSAHRRSQTHGFAGRPRGRPLRREMEEPHHRKQPCRRRRHGWNAVRLRRGTVRRVRIAGDGRPTKRTTP